MAPVAAKLSSKHQYPSLATVLSGVNIQEPRFNTPLRCSLVYHQWRAEAEHDGYHVGQCQGPSGCLGAETLRWDLGRVGVSDCGGSRCGESCEAGEEYLSSLVPKEIFEIYGAVPEENSTMALYSRNIRLCPRLEPRERSRRRDRRSVVDGLVYLSVCR